MLEGLLTTQQLALNKRYGETAAQRNDFCAANADLRHVRALAQGAEAEPAEWANNVGAATVA